MQRRRTAVHGGHGPVPLLRPEWTSVQISAAEPAGAADEQIPQGGMARPLCSMLATEEQLVL